MGIFSNFVKNTHPITGRLMRENDNAHPAIFKLDVRGVTTISIMWMWEEFDDA